MSTSIDRMYELLPAIVRLRDAQGGEPLRALLGVMAQQLDRMEAEVERGYDDLFIETCEPEVIPRIAHLLGIFDREALEGAAGGGRAWVARALAHRRRKGTRHALEQLSLDVAGWPAHAVEYLWHLVTTTSLDHLRPDHVDTVDLRRSDRLELVGGPFDGTSRTVDLRSVRSGRGRHNLPSIGVHAWTHRVWPQRWTTARAEATVVGGYRFDPLGIDRGLFAPGGHPVMDRARPQERFPGALRRRPLFDELEARRADVAMGRAPTPRWFTDAEPEPALAVRLVPLAQAASPGAVAPLPPEEIVIANLDDWDQPGFVTPASTRTYEGSGGDEVLPITVAVDPVRGRLLLLTVPPDLSHVELGWTLATPGAIGAGTHDGSFQPELDVAPADRFSRGVTADEPGVEHSPTIQDALAVAAGSWAPTAASLGVITVLDGRSYAGTGGPPLTLAIEVPRGKHLVLRAAPGMRPHVEARLMITAGPGTQQPGRLTLEGLVIEGGVELSPEALEGLTLRHCTVVTSDGSPALSVDGSAVVQPPEHELRVEVIASVCGRLAYLLPGGEDPQAPTPKTVEWVLHDSVVDAAPLPASDEARTGPAIEVSGCRLELERVTVLGTLACRELHGSDSILLGDAWAQRTQVGCLRYCYLSSAVQVPRRHRCQPSMAIAEASETSIPSADEIQRIEAAVTPSIPSLDLGSADQARVHPRSTPLVLRGAEGGSCMGALGSEGLAPRRARLESALEDSTRFGMQTGVFFVAAGE